MPKGVRRQATYSSRFDYGLPLIYLTEKFNSLNSLDRLKKNQFKKLDLDVVNEYR